MFAASMAHQAMEPPGHVFDSMPFHLKMIECLLKETSNFFHQRVERLKVVVERMLEELTKDVNMGGYVTLSFYLFLEQQQAIVLASKSNLRFATVC
jgi:hypothetical protein